MDEEMSDENRPLPKKKTANQFDKRPSAKQGFELTQQLRACSSIFMF